MRSSIGLPFVSALAVLAGASGAPAQTRIGDAAMGDWRDDAPGITRKLAISDLPAPSTPTALPAGIVARPAGAELHTLPGFTVAAFAKVPHARQIRVAPNGDIFIAQSDLGTIALLRAPDGAGAPTSQSVFAEGLKGPFGIAFYPAGPKPKWVYVAENNRVVRFPYENGDLKARGAPEVVVEKLADTVGGHVTRDVDFSKDGKTLFVSVGSGSNVSQEMPGKTLAEAQAWDAEVHATGATWGPEAHRADILRFTPEGKDEAIVATGVRNCVSLRVEPVTGAPWCVVNERDSLGDNLPFDYMTQIKTGGFYGWPWYYLGDHEDTRPKSARPDLAGKAIIPDVLFQAHSAALGLAFYTATHGASVFPAEYRGDAFVTLHGSWNRKLRTGYKVVRVKMHDGVADGSYEDVLTGFVVDDRTVWGRPVAVAVARDGALLVTDDAGGMVWRIAPSGKAK
jgi:glucose/arabinose dehydrogenase